MTLRHSILRWLAFGDMVILNADFLSNGALRNKELGDTLIDNIRVSHGAPCAIFIAKNADGTAGKAAMVIEHIVGKLSLSNSSFYGCTALQTRKPQP